MTEARLAEIKERMFDKSYLSVYLQEAYVEIMRQRELLRTLAVQQPTLIVSDDGRVAEMDRQ